MTSPSKQRRRDRFNARKAHDKLVVQLLAKNINLPVDKAIEQATRILRQKRGKN